MWLFSKKQILEGKEFTRSLPLNFSAENGDHFSINRKYKCPDLNIYFFRTAYFLPDSTLFLFRIWPVTISFLFYKKRIRHHSIKGLFDIQLSWKKRVIENKGKPYLMIHDPWTLNYYHWMTQALPRLILTLKTKDPFTLLLPENHNKEFHIKSLSILGINEWTTFEGNENYYKVIDLIYPTRDIQIGDYHDELMRELSHTFRKANHAANRPHYRIFVHRGHLNTRKLVNEGEVLAAFLSWGFTIVDFEKLNFEDQMRLVGEASILAGVHGAGLTNMLFMEAGSKVLELTAFLNGEQYYYYTLSSALGHEYYYQLCKPDSELKSIQDANLYVDIVELNRNLKLMISDKNG